jgi:hypothetical protein
MMPRSPDTLPKACVKKGTSLESHRFYRATEARWQGNAGIGLGLLANILGARIEVISEPGKGSRFAVLLPADKEITMPQEAMNDETTGSAKAR